MLAQYIAKQLVKTLVKKKLTKSLQKNQQKIKKLVGIQAYNKIKKEYNQLTKITNIPSANKLIEKSIKKVVKDSIKNMFNDVNKKEILASFEKQARKVEKSKIYYEKTKDRTRFNYLLKNADARIAKASTKAIQQLTQMQQNLIQSLTNISTDLFYGREYKNAIEINKIIKKLETMQNNEFLALSKALEKTDKIGLLEYMFSSDAQDTTLQFDVETIINFYKTLKIIWSIIQVILRLVQKRKITTVLEFGYMAWCR